MINLSRGSLERLGKKISARLKADQHDAERRMRLAVNIVHKTASAKRPMIGRKGHKVSDPSAPFGVPVAEKNGGRLKLGIQKSVEVKFDKIEGRVWVDTDDIPYAMRIEKGFIGSDSLGRVYHQAPRPFMRQAWDLQKKVVEKILMEFKKK